MSITQLTEHYRGFLALKEAAPTWALKSIHSFTPSQQHSLAWSQMPFDVTALTRNIMCWHWDRSSTMEKNCSKQKLITGKREFREWGWGQSSRKFNELCQVQYSAFAFLYSTFLGYCSKAPTLLTQTAHSKTMSWNIWYFPFCSLQHLLKCSKRSILSCFLLQIIWNTIIQRFFFFGLFFFFFAINLYFKKSLFCLFELNIKQVFK